MRFLKLYLLVLIALHPTEFVGAQEHDTLKIVFTGDLLLDRGVRQKIKYAGIDALFSRKIDSLFKRSDMVVANLECPATKIEAPVNKRFIFRAEPEWLVPLKKHGITHLNLANNHAIDQGREGLTDTYRNIVSAGMIPVGYGKNIEESDKYTLLAKYPRHIYLLTSVLLTLENVSYLPDKPCVSQQTTDSIFNLVERIKRHDPNGYIIVCLHWGAEHTLEPTLFQRQQAHHLIDGGADCLICHHTHTLQTVEGYKGKPIYYSIGNFIFDQRKPVNTKACLVQINITRNHAFAKAIRININDCTPDFANNQK